MADDDGHGTVVTWSVFRAYLKQILSYLLNYQYFSYKKKDFFFFIKKLSLLNYYFMTCKLCPLVSSSIRIEFEVYVVLIYLGRLCHLGFLGIMLT